MLPHPADPKRILIAVSAAGVYTTEVPTTAARPRVGESATSYGSPYQYAVEVQAPVEYAGDLMGDMNGRRGRIQGMDTKGSTQIVRAQAPMAEMLTYQNDLTSMTQGRAVYSMQFDHYEEVPKAVAEQIVAKAGK